MARRSATPRTDQQARSYSFNVGMIGSTRVVLGDVGDFYVLSAFEIASLRW